jgi:hypothetical protein
MSKKLFVYFLLTNGPLTTEVTVSNFMNIMFIGLAVKTEPDHR